jgi:hypothetical protein
MPHARPRAGNQNWHLSHDGIMMIGSEAQPEPESRLTTRRWMPLSHCDRRRSHGLPYCGSPAPGPVAESALPRHTRRAAGPSRGRATYPGCARWRATGPGQAVLPVGHRARPSCARASPDLCGAERLTTVTTGT